ncbi:MAG TPA: hypothetical protein P5121_02535 [Caldilineaceae bacterium]|nr:hypothetical protein [Caldilineaceae bacterium]
MLVALLWGVGHLPGHWWVAALLILLWAGSLGIYLYWRQRDFVRFTPTSFPQLQPQRLDPADKIPLFATGYFTVENKDRRFTWLPGFFRTFATREHALMCYVEPGSQIGIGHWADDEVGLWYLFFQPSDMAVLAWGELRFGKISYPALAITYQRHIPKRGRFQPERTVHETVYVAVATVDDGNRIMANLLYEDILQPKNGDRHQLVRPE